MDLGRQSLRPAGDGTLSSRTTPTLVLTQVTAVSAGVAATAALRSDGTLWTWGDNLFGQLGDGTLDSRPLPRQVLDGVAAVSMGGYHAVALRSDGSLWTWGSSIDGQLGLGLQGEDSLPSPPPRRSPLGGCHGHQRRGQPHRRSPRRRHALDLGAKRFPAAGPGGRGVRPPAQAGFPRPPA